MAGHVDPIKFQQTQHQKGFELISEALKLDEGTESKIRRRQAIRCYRKGVAELEKGIAVKFNDYGDAEAVVRAEALRAKMVKNAKMARDRADDLEKLLNNDSNSTSRPTPAPCSRPSSAQSGLSNYRSSSPHRRTPLSTANPKAVPSNSHNRTDDLSGRISKIKGVDTKLAHMILDQILERHPNVTFDDIAGLSTAKRALYEAVILPAIKPELFTGLRSPVQGLLLFGPPGNGKTMLAKAVAAEAKCVFFNISASALTSKWVGEAEKLVKALFVLARELQPSVVFIDELDSILCERSDKDNEVSRRLKTEFLLQFDGVGSSSSDRILIMGATNRPYDLDDAVLRRFPKRIFIGLPDREARADLVKKLLAKDGSGNRWSTYDLERIADSTEGYSSSDLTNLAKEAAMVALREIPPGQLVNLKASQVRPINVDDFRRAVSQVRPSTKFDQLDKLRDFAQQYGEMC